MNATLVDRFEAAVREYGVIGMLDPQDHAEIEREFKEAKQALLDAPDEQPTWLDRCAWAVLQGLLAAPDDTISQSSGPNARGNYEYAASISYDIATVMLKEKLKREGAP